MVRPWPDLPISSSGDVNVRDPDREGTGVCPRVSSSLCPTPHDEDGHLGALVSSLKKRRKSYNTTQRGCNTTQTNQIADGSRQRAKSWVAWEHVPKHSRGLLYTTQSGQRSHSRNFAKYWWSIASEAIHHRSTVQVSRSSQRVHSNRIASSSRMIPSVTCCRIGLW